MSIVSWLFKTQPKKECPRCLGKGNVDWDDIKRLNKELKWAPGSCAYCNGTGKIDPKLEGNVAVDTTYLTTDLPLEERTRLINKDPDAIERATYFDIQIDDSIKQICYLHFQGKLSSLQIAEFYLIAKTDIDTDDNEKKTFIDYINKVIEKEKEKEKNK